MYVFINVKNKTKTYLKNKTWGLPGGPMVETLPTNAGDQVPSLIGGTKSSHDGAKTIKIKPGTTWFSSLKQKHRMKP